MKDARKVFDEGVVGRAIKRSSGDAHEQRRVSNTVQGCLAGAGNDADVQFSTARRVANQGVASGLIGATETLPHGSLSRLFAVVRGSAGRLLGLAGAVEQDLLVAVPDFLLAHVFERVP